MKMLAEYLDSAIKFETLAAAETDAKLKAQFEKQAEAARRHRLCDLLHSRAARGRWSRTIASWLDEIARVAIHRSRYCLRYCSSADFSAEGSEDRRLSLRVRSGRSIPSKYRNEFARGFVIVRSSRFWAPPPM